MLIEMCCKCGFVHKDGRIRIENKPYRAYKPHYHWTPESGEVKNEDDVKLVPTICVACCDQQIDWKEFYEQKNTTPDKYQVKFSLNAPLPDRLLVWANQLYTAQCKYVQFDQ